MDNDNLRLVRKGILLASTNFDDWGESIVTAMLDSDDDRAKIAYTLSVARLEREALRLNNDEALKSFVTEFYASSSSHRQIWVLETLKLERHLLNGRKICFRRCVQPRRFKKLSKGDTRL